MSRVFKKKRVFKNLFFKKPSSVFKNLKTSSAGSLAWQARFEVWTLTQRVLGTVMGDASPNHKSNS